MRCHWSPWLLIIYCIHRTQSGNPGYLYGLPVLFGTTNSTSTKIDQAPGGLSIQAPALDGICPSVGEYISKMEVDFGYDISTACLLTLNRSAFENMCCEGTSSCAGESEFVDSAGVPYFLKPQQGYDYNMIYIKETYETYYYFIV